MEENQAVFVILYSDDFLGNPHNKKILTAVRWDNRFGYIGGRVEKGESLEEALVREVSEEIGFDLNPYKDNIDIICKNHHAKKSLDIYTCECKISIDDMRFILGNWFSAKDAEFEIAGICAINSEYNEKMLKNNFAATAKYEMETFLKKHDFFK